MTTPRAIVYIDAANLILSARTHDIGYDIRKLLRYFKDKYGADRCVYFTARIHALAADYVLLESLGVEIVYKKLYREDGKSKGNCDVEIAHRVTYDIDHNFVDRVVLVSGDGDFIPLVDFVEREKRMFELFSVSPRVTSLLFRKRKGLQIRYLKDIAAHVTNGKGPAGDETPEGTLFNTGSIAEDKALIK